MASALVPWVSCLLLVASLRGGQSLIADSCIRCLCEAISGGPFCEFGGACHDGVCGPYSITLPYWQDGGRPTVGLEDRQSNQAYENCALDKTCAEATIRGYMSKFHQDCNVDGVESCEDYAAIHFHGGYGCNKPLPVPSRNALFNCLQKQGLGDSGPTQPVQPPPPPPFEPSNPQQPDNEGNDIVYPAERTPLPEIDIRFGE